MLNIGGWELMVILLVGLVVLGPQRLPEVARQLGQTVSTLRELATGFQSEIDAASKPDIKPVSDSSMMMQGPTSRGDAIAATQDADELPDELAEHQADESADPFAGRHTDPYAIATAARAVTYDDDDAEDKAQSAGGPTDLRDEEE